MEDYPPSSLVKIKQKYYVSVTVPQRLEPFFKTKQIRRSTGTADQSAARKKQHDKTRDIYQQFIDVEAMAVVSKQDAAIAKAQQFVDELGLRADIKDLAANNPKKMTFVMGILDSVSHEFSKPMPGEPQLKPVDYLAKDMEAMSESFDVYRDADKPKPLLMSSFLEVYLEKKDWERIATRDTARTYIQRFIDVMNRPGFIGDL